jgi:hypothetical protein
MPQRVEITQGLHDHLYCLIVDNNVVAHGFQTADAAKAYYRSALTYQERPKRLTWNRSGYEGHYSYVLIASE